PLKKPAMAKDIGWEPGVGLELLARAQESSTEVDSDEFNYDQTPRRPLKILKKPAMAKAKAVSD
ncbi:unnamed protein product, partial [Symbiodinium necroappetens]